MRFISASLVVALVTVSAVSIAEEAKAPKSPSAKTSTTPKKAPSRGDVAVGAALARCDDGVSLQGASAARESAPVPSSAPASVAQDGSATGGLADVHVATARASDKAGTAREVTLASGAGSAKVAKPAATIRMQRKMAVDRTMASLGASFEACKAQAGFANGTVAVSVDVDAQGAVERAEMAGVKGTVAKATVACVVAAVAGAKFAAPGGQGAMLTVPVPVVTDRGDVTRVATSN